MDPAGGCSAGLGPVDSGRDSSHVTAVLE
jgi:hypothetical protein